MYLISVLQLLTIRLTTRYEERRLEPKKKICNFRKREMTKSLKKSRIGREKLKFKGKKQSILLMICYKTRNDFKSRLMKNKSRIMRNKSQ